MAIGLLGIVYGETITDRICVCGISMKALPPGLPMFGVYDYQV